MRHDLSDSRDLVGFCAQLQQGHEAATRIADRKRLGQVFTPPAVCHFMAGLFASIPKEFKLLDPGAGIGALSASVCERIRDLPAPRSCEFHLFEMDRALIPMLHKNMRNCQSALDRAGHSLTYTVHNEDFLLDTGSHFGPASLFDDKGELGDFDAVITNPPYFKIRGQSAYARLMPEVVHGQPNIYALFLAKAAQSLRPGGELVAITPRSFCNGLYFRGFRRWFFTRMALGHIHLFESRTHTFQAADVLQESIITLSHRLGRFQPQVTVSTSHGLELPARPSVQTLPTASVLDDSCGDMVVRIPATADELKLLNVIESWPHRFRELGLRISTGPVVLFRAREFLLPQLNGDDSVPLLLVHNIRPFKTAWPFAKKGKPAALQLCQDSLRLLVPARNYVLLRRFSAKEERRRLTASCFLREGAARPYVALENHLNYVYHAKRELSIDETYGLAALFNSALLDRYFRTLSGNTQVNASEIRTMRFPPLEVAAGIGKKIRKLHDFDTELVESIVLEKLGIEDVLGRDVMESTA